MICLIVSIKTLFNCGWPLVSKLDNFRKCLKTFRKYVLYIIRYLMYFFFLGNTGKLDPCGGFPTGRSFCITFVMESRIPKHFFLISFVFKTNLLQTSVQQLFSAGLHVTIIISILRPSKYFNEVPSWLLFIWFSKSNSPISDTVKKMHYSINSFKLGKKDKMRIILYTCLLVYRNKGLKTGNL